MKPFAIGLMSGTSADGIDAALMKISEKDNKLSLDLEHAIFEPYSEGERSRIFNAFSPDFSVYEMGRLNRDMGSWFARAVVHLLEESGVSADDVLVIGSHGQTIAHYPPQHTDDPGFCVQIGEPAVIAAITGIDVVSQFRSADMAMGGQGAPLIPYFDYALLTSAVENRVVLNIGGIANVTILAKDTRSEDVIGFDTGPGNMVLDGLAGLVSDGRMHYDKDGSMAREGRVHADLLEGWLNHPYFALIPPKSTGREQFGIPYCHDMFSEARRKGVSHADLLRTATEFVAETISRGIQSQMPEPFALIASGGGTRNPALMDALERRLNLTRRWESTAQYGIPSDYKEAMAFALFAWQFCRGVKTNLPRATGARTSVMQGSWTPARPGRELYPER